MSTASELLRPGSGFLSADSLYYQNVVTEEPAKQVVFNSSYMPGVSEGLDGLAYCVYDFYLLDPAVDPVIRWAWTGAEPSAGEFWIGVSDRINDCWEWHEAGGQHALTLDGWESYLDGNRLFVALAVGSPGEFRLDYVKVGPELLYTHTFGELEFGVGYTAAAVVNDYPAIAYIDSFEHRVYYARATDLYGFGWGDPVQVATGVLESCCLAVVDGRPAIACNQGSVLAYYRANDAFGVTWGSSTAVTTAQDSGHYGSLALINGKPAASSYTSFGGRLLFTRSSDAAGSTWAASITPVPGYGFGNYSSLAVVDGYPAISFVSGTNLCYVRATDADGTSWSPSLTVGGGSFPEFTSLIVVNGRPAISHVVGNDVAFVCAADAQGTTWNTPVAINSGGSPAHRPTLAVIGGVPAIAYHTLVPYYLYYAKANDAYGASWSAPRVLDSQQSAGEHPSLFNVQGYAAIAYGIDIGSGTQALRYMLILE